MGGEATTRTALAVATPGLEALLVDELVSLGVDARLTEGGAAFPATPDNLARVHVWSRVAADVRVRLGRVDARTLDALARGVRGLPWAEFVLPRQTVEVEISSHRSKLRRGPAVEKKVAYAIGDALRGPRLSGARPPREAVGVHLHIVDDRALVSVDASGGLLHRRGWRQATAKAPIRENLAAAVLRGAGWVPGEALVDPMCGSGTFPIEAALQAAGRSPRLGWTYAFERWPGFPADRVRREEARREPAVPTTIVAADRSEGAILATEGNARRAGVLKDIRLLHERLADLEPPCETGLLVANLPYGRRLEADQDIEARLASTRRALSARWGAWRVALLVPDGRWLPRLHSRIEGVLRFHNGGVPVVLGLGRPVSD